MQNTNSIIMVRPACFGWNAETAESNHFQHVSHMGLSEIHSNALLEFDLACDFLREKLTKVTVLHDRVENGTPDSIFPNNWFSTHASGRLVLYPMMAPNRRKERIAQFENVLRDQAFNVSEVLVLTSKELNGEFLEGTGSLVLDRENKIAYAALSPRTHEALVQHWAIEMDYQLVSFHALDRRNGKSIPIYHTNVIMSVGERVAILCSEALELNDAARVKKALLASGKKIVDITLEQVDSFAGNALELRGKKGEKLWVMSTTAHQSLTEAQCAIIEQEGEIVPLHIPTIEAVGGGSARCMIAENFFSRI